MKKIFVSLMLLVGFASAQAEVTGNVGVTTDYRFRGMSQSQTGVSLSGGVDYTNPNGLYVGNANSSVSSQLYPNGAGIESDFYAGAKRTYGGVTFDAGTMNYHYSRATTFNTSEVYLGAATGPFSFKYSRSLTDYFGTAKTRGTQYYQAGVLFPVTDHLKLGARIGRTDVANSKTLDYTDIAAGGYYDLGNGLTVSAGYFTNKAMGSAVKAANTLNGEKLYKNGLVVALNKDF